MRIEKISENQIRCTLTKSDLEEHQVLLNELAFGTDHAKDLFRDMMAQASEECGFEADDIPLMIEAVPVSPDKLVLIITKMDNPDELDEHVSKYTKLLDLFNDSEEEDAAESDHEHLKSQNSEKKEKDPLLPFSQLVQEARKLASQKTNENNDKNTKKQSVIESHRIYRFPSLAQAMDACSKIYPLYKGDATLYKDSEETFYYLILSRDHLTPNYFKQVGNVLSEFGLQIPYTRSTCAYFEEHFIKILEHNTVPTLASM